MSSQLKKLVKGFSTTPILFVGSGITRRYYGLPSWKELLEVFAKRIHNDEFVFESYENKAKLKNYHAGLYPNIAELIEIDFNNRWFTDANFRKLDEKHLLHVKNGASPFKVEIAMYIHSLSVLIPKYDEEIKKLKALTKKSISGLITTNYDTFLESNSDDYKTYIGQNELIFSSIQGIAEIYKIHGCVTQPQSIIINEDDYKTFDRKSAYLAAKLMTIFLEYPIIFIGYSISDNNIQNILKSIVNCLTNENAHKLENRFIFIQHDEKVNHPEIAPHSINFDGNIISMTKVTLSDFGQLYDALNEKKSALPARMLRLFKQEFYDYTLTNTPTTNLRVATLDDTRVDDDELVLAIGKASDFGLKGLKGLTGDEWYRNIIISDLEFTADELLENAYPSLIKQNNILPLNKYLSESTKEFPTCASNAKDNDFEKIISSTIKKQRNKIRISNRSVLAIWNSSISFEKKTSFIAHLTIQEIIANDLEAILKEIFVKNADILSTATTPEKTNIRRLIRIFDYLKYAVK